MKLILLIVLIFVFGNHLLAQEKVHELKGIICDSLTKKPLSDAIIEISSDLSEARSMTTSGDGLFRFTLSAAQSYQLFINYFGQKLVLPNVKITRDSMISVVMTYTHLLEMIEVKVSGVRKIENDMVTSDITITSRRIGRRHQNSKKPISPPVYLNPSRESYAVTTESGFSKTSMSPLSTFSIDVDRASYSNIRRLINGRQAVPVDAVRIEEMINYFEYKYPEAQGQTPYALHYETSKCPWNQENELLLVAMNARKVAASELPPSNLVFLVDVSGSMYEDNKLPLVKYSLGLLTDQLRKTDKISLVVYAGASGCILQACSGDQKEKIREALNNLEAGGSTAGAEGINLAYEIAQKEFIKGFNNRVVLCTDGDFNVGLTSLGDLQRLIEQKRNTGIFLSCMGFGMGNYKDDMLKTLAGKGNGNYGYIDNREEARKLFVREFSGTIYAIAKDVKFQIEFNPAYVSEYRLVGYEDRRLQNEDFENDQIDAGDLGSGHCVTALYELVMNKVQAKQAQLRYVNVSAKAIPELAIIKTKYKFPASSISKEVNLPILKSTDALNRNPENIGWASAVAWFGMTLNQSKFLKEGSCEDIISLARQNISNDNDDYRSEFIALVRKFRNDQSSKDLRQ